jgi:hypothetical protein
VSVLDRGRTSNILRSEYVSFSATIGSDFETIGADGLWGQAARGPGLPGTRSGRRGTRTDRHFRHDLVPPPSGRQDSSAQSKSAERKGILQPGTAPPPSTLDTTLDQTVSLTDFSGQLLVIVFDPADGDNRLTISFD